MPKIPIILADEPIPSRTTRRVRGPYEGTAVERAMGEFGETGQAAAYKILEQDTQIKNKLKEADDLVTRGKKKEEYVLFGQTLSNQLRSDPKFNPDTHLNNVIPGLKKKKDEILSTVQDNLLNKTIAVDLDRITLSNLIEEKDYSYKKKSERIVADTESLIISAANRGDIEEVKRLTKSIVDIGAASPSWKVKQDNMAEETAEKSLVASKLGSKNPEEIESLIKDLNAGKYKSLNPLEREGYKIAGRTEIDRIKREDENKKVDETYSHLKKTYGDLGYSTMLTVLKNLKYQEEQGITGTQANKVENLLKSEWATEEADKKDRYDATARKFFDMVDKGKLGTKEIDEAVRKDQISWQIGEHFRNAVVNPPDIKSDAGEYISIMKDIDSGADKYKMEQKILSSTKLSREDKKSLGSRLYREEDKVNDVWLKKSEKYIEDIVIPKRGMMAPILRTEEETKDYYAAVQSFHTALEDAAKRGKPLQGQELFNRAREVVAGFQKPISEQLLRKFSETEKAGKEFEKAGRIKKLADKYKTLDEVKKDLSSKRLTQDEAIAIVKYKGWGD